MKSRAGWIVAALLGIALGYFVRGSGATRPRAAAAASEAPAGLPMTVGRASPETESDDGATRVDPRDRVAPGPAATPPTASGAPTIEPPRNAVVELPGGKLDARDSGSKPPLDKLLDAMSAYCTFDAGAGGMWPQGKILAHTAAWQGGPLELDVINLVEHTAQLTRHPWRAPAATPIELHAEATNSGLHVSGIKPDGELIVMTVFGTLDSDSRYRAVVSMHGTNLDHESAQFYGWCTVR